MKERNQYEKARNNKVTILMDGRIRSERYMSMNICRIGVDIDEYT